MVVLPSHDPETISREKYEAVRKQLQIANQRIRQLEQENQQLRAREWQERKLRKKKDFKPAEKLILSELQRQIESPNAHKDTNGFTRFCYATAALNTGMSESTPKRKIEAIFEQWPDCPIEAKTITEHAEGKKIDRLYVKLKEDTNLIQAAIDATLSEEHIRKQGGNKYICQRCGSVNVRIIRRLHCDCCGHETDLEDTYPNGKLKNSTRKSNLLSEDDRTEDSQEESNTGETRKSNLLLADIETEDIESIAHFFDASLQLDDVHQELQLRQVANEERDESNKPHTHTVSFASDPDSIIRDWLEARCGSIHIINSTGIIDNPQGKYIYKPQGYQPNLDAFIAGNLDHIYGSRLLHPETGLTNVLCFEIDQAEQDEQVENYLVTLALAGAAPVYWCRYAQGRQRGHLELYFSRSVDPERARAWALAVCPDLAEIAECYPCKEPTDKRNQALSWPFYQRIADTVYPCKAKFILPDPHDGSLQECDPTDKQALASLVALAVTPAALVEAFTTVLEARSELQPSMPTQESEPVCFIGEKPRPSTQVASERDLREQVIADFCAQYSWDDIAALCGGWEKGFFKAVWRGERTASVRPDRDGRYACDYGNHGSYPKKLDIYGAYCLICGIDQKADIAERCAQLRRAEMKVETTSEKCHSRMANGLASGDMPTVLEMNENGHFPGEPCRACSCELYRMMADEPACIRCYPKNGSAEIADRLYPKKVRAGFGK